MLIPHVAAFWRDPTLLDPVFEAQDREQQRRRAGVEQQNLRAPRGGGGGGRGGGGGAHERCQGPGAPESDPPDQSE